MKKIGFAMQVFGIIILFPLYVVLEMSHGTGSLPQNNDPAGIYEKTTKPSIESSLHAGVGNESYVAGKRTIL